MTFTRPITPTTRPLTVAFIGASATGKSTLARFVSETYCHAGVPLPINPIGSRSVAKEMGFVGPDPVTGELVGRPYDVDRACGYCYARAPSDRFGFASTRETFTHAEYALMCKPQEITFCGHVDRTVRPLFQQRLAEAKIVWEDSCSRCRHEEIQHDGHDQTGSGYCRKCDCDAFQYPAFVTDRTPLDDMAYALMHCPEIVTEAFRDRAYTHTKTYDFIFYCPLAAGQWLDGDAARVSNERDPTYHWRYDVLLQGLMSDAFGGVVAIEAGHSPVITFSNRGLNLDDRMYVVRQAIYGFLDEHDDNL